MRTGLETDGQRKKSDGQGIAISMETENFSTTFTYDNKGRLSTRTHPSGIVETNNYNSNGYLASISAGGATRFTITTMNARQQITAATYGSNPGFPPSGEREGGCWIGGDAYTAPCVAVKTNSGAQVYYYLLRDYLGNITHQLDMSNNVVAEYSFDSWGRRRDKDDWTYTLSGEPDLLAGRGFTSHEWLPWFNLYNMNGRLYDPVVGRFLSADNYVQMADFTQSYNRYSYVLNNPLKYTDPSGELPFLATLAIVVAGNYAIGWLDNVINKGMSAKEAFKNTNFIMGVDFNPGDMSKQNNYGFTNSQVDAHNEPKKDQERTEKVNKKLDDVRQSHSSTWYAANGVGIMGEFVGTTGFGLNFEIAFPKFVTTNLFSYTGAGIDVGILRDRNGLGFYATTKTTKESGVAFSAQVEFLNAYNRPSSAPNVNIDRTYLVGPGYETGLGIGPIGGSYGVSNAADYGRISTYQMISISLGLGIDAGFVNWNTNTYVTGGY